MAQARNAFFWLGLIYSALMDIGCSWKAKTLYSAKMPCAQSLGFNMVDWTYVCPKCDVNTGLERHLCGHCSSNHGVAHPVWVLRFRLESASRSRYGLISGVS